MRQIKDMCYSSKMKQAAYHSEGETVPHASRHHAVYDSTVMNVTLKPYNQALISKIVKMNSYFGSF